MFWFSDSFSSCNFLIICLRESIYLLFSFNSWSFESIYTWSSVIVICNSFIMLCWFSLVSFNYLNLSSPSVIADKLAIELLSAYKFCLSSILSIFNLYSSSCSSWYFWANSFFSSSLYLIYYSAYNNFPSKNCLAFSTSKLLFLSLFKEAFNELMS